MVDTMSTLDPSASSNVRPTLSSLSATRPKMSACVMIGFGSGLTILLLPGRVSGVTRSPLRRPAPRACRRRSAWPCSGTIVRELNIEVQALSAQVPDDDLQVVPVLSLDAELVPHEGRLDLRLEVLDQADDLARLIAVDALLEIHRLRHGPPGGVAGLAELQ